ncbi:MAG: DUF1223 domain-containing protein [Bradyrhizobiaceae bacterium]|nr:MAG: DUF1223 domain-containing protein [Bradyrhizobiaceae bacterium]
MLSRIVAATAAVLALGVPAIAMESDRASERPVVVELFTSQGCSSCPPANAYLTDLVRSRKDVLPLGFHVTYWNRLGWVDPFSFEGATQRQAAYGSRFGDGSYTPEIVVNGKVSFVGSHRAQGEAAIDAAKREAASAPVTVTRKGGSVSINVGQGSGNARVILVGYDAQHSTKVPRGENSGQTLVESNVVRSFQKVGDWAGQPVTLNVASPAGEEIAVLLEAPDGSIVGAARASDSAS